MKQENRRIRKYGALLNDEKQVFPSTLQVLHIKATLFEVT